MMQQPSTTSLQTFSVSRKPFSVPRYLNVVRSEGFSAYGDAVLAYPTIQNQNANSNKATTDFADYDDRSAGGTGPSSGRAGGNNSSSSVAAAAAAGAGGSGGGSEFDRAVVVRKYENIIGCPRALAAVSRMVALSNILPSPSEDTANSDTVSSSSMLDMGAASTLVPILDVYVDASRRNDIYVVTPKYPTTLAAVLNSSTPLRADQILFILHQVTIAVHTMHSLGVVVGEIRPEAIWISPHLLGAPGSVRLGDYSFCHLPTETLGELAALDPTLPPPAPPLGMREAVTGNGSAGGIYEECSTPTLHRCYRAPEWVLELTSCVGFAADMWSIGALLVEMLTRRPLWATSDGGGGGSSPRATAEYLQSVSQMLGYPTDDQFITNTVAKSTWKAVSASWQPIGVASLLPTSPHEGRARQLIQLAKRLLVLEPSKRLTAEELLTNSLFHDMGLHWPPLQHHQQRNGSPLGHHSQAGTHLQREASLLSSPPNNKRSTNPILHNTASNASIHAGARGGAGSAAHAVQIENSWAVSTTHYQAQIEKLAEFARVVV